MILSLLLCFIACSKAQNTSEPAKVAETEEVRPAAIVTGDLQTEAYFPLLEGKRIGVYSNQTGMAGDEHVVDLLKRSGFNLIYILSPEHGFRGDADAGEKVDNSVDAKSGQCAHLDAIGVDDLAQRQSTLRQLTSKFLFVFDR